MKNELLPEDTVMLDPDEHARAVSGEPLPGEEDETFVTEPEAPEKKPASDPDWKKELADLRAELREERAARRDSEGALRTWMDRERTPAKAEPEEEPETEVDLVEVISSGDKKAITKALRGLGFVAQGEVEELVSRRVNGARAGATRDAELVGAFPDLADEESEFYEATARHYKALEADGIAGPKLLELAANSAAAELGVQRVSKRSRKRDDDEPAPRRRGDRDEEDEDRARRVGAQSGVRAARRDTPTGGDEDLSPMQKRICQRLGITEASYRKRAGRGIQLGGLPNNRAA